MESQDAVADFASWVRRFEKPLVAYAARILGDRDRARDVVQDTFVHLERRLRAEREAVPTSWLFTVCRNRALNICRKDRRLAFLDEAILETQPSASHGPAEQLEEKELGKFLMRIIATLPPRQQEALQLRFQNDLSYQEIGEITQSTANNVGVLIHTALKNLRARYHKDAREFIEP
ncbi:MAG: sigma-70 family RNA polymerase sigma factor [Verrucomicrobiota bacterium]|nr:sigma-70 family RNA polymerase sigma factor [Verrucomicrobiota bacterium]